MLHTSAHPERVTQICKKSQTGEFQIMWTLNKIASIMMALSIIACESYDRSAPEVPSDEASSASSAHPTGELSALEDETKRAQQQSTANTGEISIVGDGTGGSNLCSATGELVGYTEADDPDYGIRSFTLWAGKHNDAGQVTITSDDETLFVTIDTNETADLIEMQVYVWTADEELPTYRPAPGLAPYKAEGINADRYTLAIPRAAQCGEALRLSVHAALGADSGSEGSSSESNAGETAYAGGPDSPSCYDLQERAWWGVADYTVECFYNISGVIYEDLNQSFDREEEPTFEGVEVSLRDAAGSLIASATTDASGAYLFEHLSGGREYRVSSAAPADGYTATEGDPERVIAELIQDETDQDFGFYRQVDPPEPPEPPAEVTCETAFAYDGTGAGDFRRLDLNGDGRGDFSRWGWTIGPLSAGESRYDIYAGAGQSDIQRGTRVGELTVSYEGGAVALSYQLSGDFTLTEVHAYVGETPVPMARNGRYTVAPGQFSLVQSAEEGAQTYNAQLDASGDVYVIAHAVVCGSY